MISSVLVIEFAGTGNLKNGTTKLESIWVCVNSLIIIGGSVLGVGVQAEHERLAVIHPFTTAIPVLRCVATTDPAISDFADNKSGTLVEHSFFEFGNLPTVYASRVDPG